MWKSKSCKSVPLNYSVRWKSESSAGNLTSSPAGFSHLLPPTMVVCGRVPNTQFMCCCCWKWKWLQHPTSERAVQCCQHSTPVWSWISAMLVFTLACKLDAGMHFEQRENLASRYQCIAFAHINKNLVPFFLSCRLMMRFFATSLVL